MTKDEDCILYCPCCGECLGITFNELREVLDTWLCSNCDVNAKDFADVGDFPKTYPVTLKRRSRCGVCRHKGKISGGLPAYVNCLNVADADNWHGGTPNNPFKSSMIIVKGGVGASMLVVKVGHCCAEFERDD